MRLPLDAFPYDKDPRSRPIALGIEDGTYVYVQDIHGTVHVLPDGPHLHPKVLGKAEPAMYAGDLRVERGIIQEITNLSGTFQFDSHEGLVAVAQCLLKIGFSVDRKALRFFPGDGSRPVVVDFERRE